MTHSTTQDDLLRQLEGLQWRQSSPLRRRELTEAVASALGTDFRFGGWAKGTTLVRYRPADLELALIPGGEFVMGYSAAECEELRGSFDGDEELIAELEIDLARSLPARTVQVAPFLLSVEPVDLERVRRVIALHGDPEWCGDRVKPAHVDEWAARIPPPFRLPSEAEWEHAVRADRKNSLFLCDERLDLIDGSALDVDVSFDHPYALRWLGCWPEACSDAWHPSHHGAPDDASPWVSDGVGRVVRPGIAWESIPWQVGEWISATTAFRQSSLDPIWSEDLVAFRLALSLPGPEHVPLCHLPADLTEGEPRPPDLPPPPAPPRKTPRPERTVSYRKRVDLFKGLPERAVDDAYEQAAALARERGHLLVEPIHLLTIALAQVAPDSEVARQECERELASMGPSPGFVPSEVAFGLRAIEVAALSAEAFYSKLAQVVDPATQRARRALGPRPETLSRLGKILWP